MDVQQFATQALQVDVSNANEAEKTISLQLLSLATFVVTILGAFIAVDQPSDFSTGIKVVLLIDLLMLFASMICGVVHLLLTKSLFQKAVNAKLTALRAMEKVNSASEKERIYNAHMDGHSATTNAFMYAQIATLALAFGMFVGLIIAVLFTR